MRHRKSEKDLSTYWHVVARDTDYKGIPRCINCSDRADDVHEILPRSFLGASKEDELFAMKNRCCLCRKCHEELHNDRGRGKLLEIMNAKFGYSYEGIAQCLLEDYLGEG